MGPAPSRARGPGGQRTGRDAAAGRRRPHLGPARRPPSRGLAKHCPGDGGGSEGTRGLKVQRSCFTTPGVAQSSALGGHPRPSVCKQVLCEMPGGNTGAPASRHPRPSLQPHEGSRPPHASSSPPRPCPSGYTVAPPRWSPRWGPWAAGDPQARRCTEGRPAPAGMGRGDTAAGPHALTRTSSSTLPSGERPAEAGGLWCCTATKGPSPPPPHPPSMKSGPRQDAFVRHLRRRPGLLGSPGPAASPRAGFPRTAQPRPVR